MAGNVDPAAITAVVEPRDEVIIIEPAYDSYAPVIHLNGGIPVFLKMKNPDYRIDWNEVKSAINGKTRLIMLNSPHNPTGMILSQEDIGALIDIVKDTNLFIISDEVYEHIIFDQEIHHSMIRYPELAERSFVISSFGKTYHTTGWKLGYCLAPHVLSKEFQRVHQFLTFASNTPMQLAYADFMEREEIYLSLSAFYQEKRDLFLSLLRESGFKPLKCSGTYFQMLDYSEISDDDDMAFARWLTTDKGVAAIPPSVFYSRKNDNRVLRFCFAKRDETLKAAAEILCGLQK